MDFTQWLRQLDFSRYREALLLLAAALPCLIVHECAHGFAAQLCGDPTAKAAGRLSLNPLRHIDWLGLAAMVFCRFGWAKPVPVDMRKLRHPKRDMALVALAGPVSNFLLAFPVFVIYGILCYVYAEYSSTAVAYGAIYCYDLAVLSLGLGVFNLFPIPPLDGSKVLFSLLPERIYRWILRYERYGSILLLLLLWFDVLSAPLFAIRNALLGIWETAAMTCAEQVAHLIL